MLGHDPQHTYRVAIIGAGSGGLTVALGLARLGHHTVLIEAGKVGGDCTNVGCIPSKALLHAARTGLDDPLDWARSRRDDLATIEDAELISHPQIHLLRGRAHLTHHRDPHVVDVEGPEGNLQVRAEHVVIAAGSGPIEIAIPGLQHDRVLTNESLFDIAAVPTSMTIVGAGAIGVEMATAFNQLGARVDVVERDARVLPLEDPLVGDTVRAAMEEHGVRFHLGTTIASARDVDGDASDHSADGPADGPAEQAVLTLDNGDEIPAQRVLLALGRRPHLDRLGLDAAGVSASRSGVQVDAWGATNVDGIWGLGDVTGATHTTHGAEATGRRIVMAIAYPRMPRRGAARAIPSVVFATPEVAAVGLSRDAVEATSASGRRRYVVQLSEIDRGVTDGVHHGFVLVDAQRFSGKVLRAVVVGPHASEIIGQFTIAIDQGLGLRKLFGMVHPYPTYAAAIGRIADDFAMDTYPHLFQEWWASRRAWLGQRRMIAKK